MNDTPAFPAKEADDFISTGMTLRDYFAAAYLTGAAGNPEYSHLKSELIAESAYNHADAMLAERERK